MPVLPTARLHFGPFELDVQSGELFKFGQKLKLQGQPIQILSILLEKPGALVTREELRQRLWPAETFVDFDHGLNTSIRKLRAALGDEAETPQYIETLPRRGYRFVGAKATEDVEHTSVAEPSVSTTANEAAARFADSAASAGTVASAPSKKTHRAWLSYRPLLVALLVTAFATLGFLLLRSARSLPNRIVVTGTRQLTYLGDVTGRILTDGRRIYFTSKGKNPLRYVSVNGGEETVIPCPLSRFALSLHIIPDGSYILLKQAYGPRGGIEAPIWLVGVNSGAARRLGDIEAQDAAFAPDGKTILVAKQRELYLTDMQGANPVKLAEAPGKVFWPRWSPDGLRLRFHVWDGVTRTLWELNRDGNLHQLLTRLKKPRSVCCGEWTADGRYYLFKGDGQYWSVSDRPGAANAEPAALTTFGLGVGSVAPSPWGNTIYVSVEQGGGQDTFKWDLIPNHIPSPLYPELKADVLEFSRDGRWIAYSHRVPAGRELWRARADGTEKLQLTAPFQEIFMVKYSPDGRKIAFMAFQPEGPWKIYWVSAEGGALHEIPSPITGQADPAWSPDSQSIMFGQTPEDLGGGAPTVTRRLHRYDLRTEKTTEISGSDGLFSPRSSPDGRYLSAILADWQGMSLMSTATSKWQPLTRQMPTGTPFWSPDSAWVYFNEIGNTVLWRVHVPDGRVEELGPIRLPPGYNDCLAETLTSDGTAILECWDSRADILEVDYKDQK